MTTNRTITIARDAGKIYRVIWFEDPALASVRVRCVSSSAITQAP
jgi:hypothetical protein